MAIFGHSPSSSARDSAIDGLNTGDLHGLVMTDKVGGCGHNLTGANVMIFMGSLYSAPYEQQAIGKALPLRIIASFELTNGSTDLPPRSNQGYQDIHNRRSEVRGGQNGIRNQSFPAGRVGTNASEI